jgi:hypothetical protein
VEGDVYAAPELLGRGEWDVVFTGIGALGWLPNIKKWAETVSALLKPGSGELFIREGHPVLFAIGDRDPTKLVMEYPYFETGPIVSEEPSTYVRLEMEGKIFEARKTVEWNHGLGEIVGALIGVGLRVVMLEEHRSVPWNALPGLMVDVGDGEFLFFFLIFSWWSDVILRILGLLTCWHRRVGAGDGEGSNAFVIYSTGCQGVDFGRPTMFIMRATSALFSNQGNHTSIQTRPVLPSPSKPTNRRTEKHESVNGKRIVHIRAVDVVRCGKGQVDRDVDRPHQSVYVYRHC